MLAFGSDEGGGMELTGGGALGGGAAWTGGAARAGGAALGGTGTGTVGGPIGRSHQGVPTAPGANAAGAGEDCAFMSYIESAPLTPDTATARVLAVGTGLPAAAGEGAASGRSVLYRRTPVGDALAADEL